MTPDNKTRLLTVLLLPFLLPILTSSSLARSSAQKERVQRQFSHWLMDTFWQKARRAGISQSVYKTAFAKTRLNWTLPDLLPPAAARQRTHKAPAQSEFRAPGRYFKAKYLNYNITKGRSELKKWRRTLDKIERRYGVPREIIISIWGKETAFGRAKLPYSAIQVLATQAFMGRRKALFETELLAALKIVQQGHISARNMKSAWAGALGHPQFMPTAFLKYAVDFDGDGHKNIWTSVPDALASIAHFLARNGWDRKQHWGREIELPASISCTLEGPDQKIVQAQWQRSGVRPMNGTSLGAANAGKKAFLLLPAGRYGPAFLVSKNFYVLKTYNESDVYALFVGHVADRMRGTGPLKAGWRRINSFSRRQVKAAQVKLEKSGADVGGADGLIGYKTRISIGRWQHKNGRKESCFPSRDELADISN